MSKQGFKHIFLMGSSRLKGVPETLVALTQHLAKHTVSLTIEQSTATLFDSSGFSTANTSHLPKEIDLIVVIGGDGSMINSAHTALAHQIPVLGINRGRLGFLTDISPDSLDSITEILAGDYDTEQRFFLEATLTSGGEEITVLALNEIVLKPSSTTHMLELETRVNDTLLYHQYADGMICATPTGSTAYALSGGGPIIQPGIDAMVLVPIFSHTLSSRPIVIPGSNIISFHIASDNNTQPFVFYDGITRHFITPGTAVRVRKHQHTLQLVHPNNYCYYESLRTKLGWQKQASRR